MEVIHFPQHLPEKGTAVTVGFFDGVHLGHRFLIDRLRSESAQRGLKSVVVTFVSHPRKVTLSSYQPALLTTLDEKLVALRETDVDYCYLIDFTKELSSLTAREFMIQVLMDKLSCSYLLMGYDHRFGSDRIEGVADYRKLASALGIELEMASAFVLGDLNVSSSTIRRSLLEGSVKDIAQQLGRRYRIVGSVVHGKKLGRKIGFPTANISPLDRDQLLPAHGVYLVRVSHNSFSRFGMMNIGHRPSLYDQGELTLEIHLFDFNGDLYEEILEIEFIDFIRSEKRFGTLDELIEQLRCDHQRCRSIIADCAL